MDTYRNSVGWKCEMYTYRVPNWTSKDKKTDKRGYKILDRITGGGKKKGNQRVGQIS